MQFPRIWNLTQPTNAREAESRVRSVLEKDFTVQVGAAVMSEVKHMLTMANIDRDDMEGSLQRAVQNIDIPASSVVRLSACGGLSIIVTTLEHFALRIRRASCLK